MQLAVLESEQGATQTQTQHKHGTRDLLSSLQLHGMNWTESPETTIDSMVAASPPERVRPPDSKL